MEIFDTQKAFDKIQAPFMTKILKKMKNRGNYLNIIVKVMDVKPTANLIFNGERLKGFPLISGMN